MTTTELKPHKDTCPRCDGWGYKQGSDEQPVVELVDDQHVTTHLGHGCVKCGGTGRVD